ncbi:MAG: PSP1 domain-containing protein [Bacteroidota bacterium]
MSGSIMRGFKDLDENKLKIDRVTLDSLTKLGAYDWLEDIPLVYTHKENLVEVRFKNTRKGYYINTNFLRLERGDIVAVEASPGHDIGIVSLTGPLVAEQVKKVGLKLDSPDFKKVYRKAKPNDLDKWKESINLEHKTMLKARKIAEDLKLDMKIGDVEYQGDRTKAIFYYIADERVDFRELIKVLADEFRIRIEMRQIGARQEAGRIGGIGPCGRELCCATWITNFVSVTTNSARYQEVSLNPQKLAGQCSKLKCCLNYEVECYLDAQKDFPDISIPLETGEGTAYHQKTDVHKRLMWYSSSPDSTASLVEIPVDRVKEIIEMNKKGSKPARLMEEVKENKVIGTGIDYENEVGKESLTRFEKKKRKGGKSKKGQGRRDKNKKNTGRNEK